MSQGAIELDSILKTLQLEPSDGLSIADATRLANAHHPPFGPDTAALLINLPQADQADRLQQALAGQYPAGHPIRLLVPKDDRWQVEPGRLNDLGRRTGALRPAAVHIPPLTQASSFATLQETVAHLRAPEGCPWDRAQTHQSLRKHLLEETYEVLEALDAGDLAALEEELGDLLLQVLLQAQIASEFAEFNAFDVVAGIQAKLVRRHPHVFGDLELANVEQVLRNWEHFKQAEKGNGVLDGVPVDLPALAQAEELQGRAARVGFDWPQVEGVLDKVGEELAELGLASDPQDRAQELGDALFSIVNYARWIEVDPEAALRESNLRFRRRFDRMAQTARQSDRRMDQMGIEELERLWEAAKHELG